MKKSYDLEKTIPDFDDKIKSLEKRVTHLENTVEKLKGKENE